MHEHSIQMGGQLLRVVTLNTVVVGSGAAGYHAALQLLETGQTDVLLLTEGVHAGTSRNTGSDKQTYYKLTLAGDEPDSVHEMTQTLFDGQCVDGDIALCEAALSAECFFELVRLGVPFPRNSYGEYVGYKTDHDPRARATSAGPYTSKMMTECLQAAAERAGLMVLDTMQVIRVFTEGGAYSGLLCLDTAGGGFVLFHSRNAIYATGGPAGIYAHSAYPACHSGATGLALEAGVAGRNLTEWQYGLASLMPRWNVSGTYMQVLPRFFSTDAEGGDEREFLYDFFKEESELLDKVFLKGYQWPFDVRKIREGSSIIDLLAHLEIGKGRRVFLDFRENPGGKDMDFNRLGEEAHAYLAKAGACFGTPYQRLCHMNAPAAAFFRDHGVDLAAQRLEIALCAQHNNGGLAVDRWWQSNIAGFFAVGEAAGTHGVYRPGGSALNAGQVGGRRAAQYIAARRTGIPEQPPSERVLRRVEEMLYLAGHIQGRESNLEELRTVATWRMSRIAGPIRDIVAIRNAISDVQVLLNDFAVQVRIASPLALGAAFRFRDLLLAQRVYLAAMADYSEHHGKSRGSALYIDPEGESAHAAMENPFAFLLDDSALAQLVQEGVCLDGEFGPAFTWRPVRPIPPHDDFFENVWRAYRENRSFA